MPLAEMPTRREVDAEFHLALLACGVGRELALVMWGCVRMAAFATAMRDKLNRISQALAA